VGKEKRDQRKWQQYNKQLVRKGEIPLNLESQNWERNLGRRTKREFALFTAGWEAGLAKARQGG